MTEKHRPLVPRELKPYMEDDLHAEVVDRWAGYEYRDIQAMMPEPQVFTLTDDRRVRAVVLEPSANDIDTEFTLGLALPYQQAWKPSMFIRAAIARDIVAPNSRMVVLPNNSLHTHRTKYYELEAAELSCLYKGDLGPFYEIETRTLEALRIKGRLALSGYSQGGLTVLGIAATGSDRLDIAVVNSDEAPNAERLTKQLKSDFKQTGGWHQQREAIADADLPCLSAALNPPRLALDYLHFAMAYPTAHSQALMHGMSTPNFPELIMRAYSNYPDMVLKLGYIVGSSLFDTKVFTPRTVPNSYSGAAAREHATGDNPFAHALMFEHAMRLAA